MEKSEIKISEGIYLHLQKTDRFKTNYIVINILSKLDRKSVTSKALIPLVLRRGSMLYPTMQDISVKLEEMYGASFDATCEKIGDSHSIQFVMDMISDEYALEKSNLLKDGINLMCDVLLNPALENGTFKEEYVSQEKETVKEIISSKINDKASYSLDRAIEEMYKGLPFGIYKYGYVEDLDKITSSNLYKAYCSLLKEAQIDIYVSGNVSPNEITELFKDAFKNLEREYDTTISELIYNKEELNEETVEVVEEQNVTQGKIVFGYKLDSQNLADDFYKMAMYCAILGGTASSKLFNNVREKKSLAYTIRSQFIKHKGAIIVSAGIELDNYKLAKECIFKEINDMKIGEITPQEIADAKVNLTTLYKSAYDSQTAMIGWEIGQNCLHAESDIDVVIDGINHVSLEDILDVASRLKLKISYYLCERKDND